MDKDIESTKIKRKHDRYHILAAVIIIVFFLTLGTISFHVLEEWSFAESFYFSVATLTTVGYGDLHPTYDLSRIFAAFYILFGVGASLASITIIATDRINVTAARMRNNASVKKEDN